MDKRLFWRAALIQAAAVAVVAGILIALPLGDDFFEDYGIVAGPLAWILCAVFTALDPEAAVVAGACSPRLPAGSPASWSTPPAPTTGSAADRRVAVFGACCGGYEAAQREMAADADAEPRRQRLAPPADRRPLGQPRAPARRPAPTPASCPRRPSTIATAPPSSAHVSSPRRPALQALGHVLAEHRLELARVARACPSASAGRARRGCGTARRSRRAARLALPQLVAAAAPAGGGRRSTRPTSPSRSSSRVSSSPSVPSDARFQPSPSSGSTRSFTAAAARTARTSPGG